MASDSTPILRGFKTICSAVSVTYVLLGSSMLIRGARASMQPFGVPEVVLTSAYFADFFHFLFIHMIVIGLLIGTLGWFVQHDRQQRMAARLLCVIQLHYTYLDLRTSDSIFGNGLYRGSASITPALVDLVVTLAFAFLSVRPVKSP
jgi:hypothetical protein